MATSRRSSRAISREKSHAGSKSASRTPIGCIARASWRNASPSIRIATSASSSDSSRAADSSRSRNRDLRIRGDLHQRPRGQIRKTRKAVAVHHRATYLSGHRRSFLVDNHRGASPLIALLFCGGDTMAKGQNQRKETKKPKKAKK